MTPSIARFKSQPSWTRKPASVLAWVLLASVGCLSALPSAHANRVPPHGVAAANIDVTVNGFDNTTNSVTVTTSLRVNDFRIREGSNNGDYNVQIGEDAADDVDKGVLITSVRQNGRDNGHPLYPGTNFVTSHLGIANDSTTNGYWVPLALTLPNSFSTSVIEYDMNVAAAWFPYDQWIGGYAHYSAPATMNNTTLDAFTGSPGLVLGKHFVDVGGAKYTVDLTSLGIDSRTDGVLLVLGAKNEDNYALSQVDTNNGTWSVWSKDNGNPSGERDPIAFVFVPRTNMFVISGRFLGNGTIDMFSGSSPRFTVTNLDVGRWELKIPGLSPAHGVLIISPEGGFPHNQDNIVSYEENAAGDGWIIESRNIPAIQQEDMSWLAPLETPGDGTEPVASFAFILGATPGFSVTPTENLQTSEKGGTASFTVVLDAPPTADVTIGVSSSDPSEGIVAPASLTFTPGNWDQPQTVTVTGQDDTLEDGPVSYRIELGTAVSTDDNYSGIDPVDVTVLNADSEAGITVTPTGGLTTTEAGGTATFTVQLNTQPTADVTLSLASSDVTEGLVAPETLNFTPANWNAPQVVTVTGVNDRVDDGDIAYSILTSAAISSDPDYNGKDALDVAVTNINDDTAGIHIEPTQLSITEGATASYSVVLGSQPEADVVINVTSGSPAQGPAAPSTLTFTPQTWATPQVVTITAVDNAAGGGDVVYAVSNSVASSDTNYAVLHPEDVLVTLLDDEATITVPAEPVVYGSGMPAIAIAGRATVSDPHTTNYSQGTLTVAITNNASEGDRLEIQNIGSGPGQIGLSGNEITYEGTAIGTVAGGTGSAPLVITFNSAATPVAVQGAMRAVTFRDVNAEPSPAARSVSLTLAHADGGSGTATLLVKVGLLRVAEFQQGVDHGYGIYTNAADIELSQINPDVAYPMGHNGNGLWIDSQTPGGFDNCQVLLRFDNIAGELPGQIPTNAIIVDAQLILNVPAEVSNAQGDASPLYRMLVPWDAEAATYNSVGNGFEGFVPDDVHARSTYDSCFGLANGDASTGTGKIGFSVRPDVQAWVNAGEANYGWLMPGWPERLDGTALSPSEAANPDVRPRLRVTWLPAGTAVASFRQDVDGYTGARDTRIRANAPDTEYSTVNGVYVDYQVSAGAENDEQVLLKFGDIIGTGMGQIPPGARIEAAMLDLSSTIGNAMGDGGHFHSMLRPWEDTDTWTSLDNGVTADGTEAVVDASVAVGSPALDPNVQAAFLSFDVSADVQAWTSGLRPNYGWVILPWTDGGDGWGFGTSEQTEEVNRPRLRVFYTAGVPGVVQPRLLSPVWSPENVKIRFTGQPNTSYSVQHAPSPSGAWAPDGMVTTDATGQATYTDTTSNRAAAFYRVSKP